MPAATANKQAAVLAAGKEGLARQAKVQAPKEAGRVRRQWVVQVAWVTHREAAVAWVDLPRVARAAKPRKQAAEAAEEACTAVAAAAAVVKLSAAAAVGAARRMLRAVCPDRPDGEKLVG